MNRLYCSLFLLLLAVGNVRADEGDMLYAYRQSAASPTRISLNNLDKITFTDTAILFKGRTLQTSVPFDDFSYIKFTADYVVPVEHVLASTNDVRIIYQPSRNEVIVEGQQPLGGVAVYDLRGRLIVADRSASDRYSLSLASAPRGLYLVHVMGEGKTLSRKIVKP